MTTVFFAGGEDTSFIISDIYGYTMGTGGSFYRSAFARTATGLNVGNFSGPSATDPPAFRLTTPAFSPQSILWAHAQFGNGSGATPATNGATLLRLLDSGGNARIVVRSTTVAGQFTISTRNNAGAFVVLATTAANAMTTGTFAVDLFCNYAVSGQATLYINGISVADTGAGVDVTTNSVTALAQVDFGTVGTQGTSPTNWWSECIVQSTSTLGCALQTIPPVASGNTQSWLPNTVGNINAVGINDANFIATTAANALSEWTLSTVLPTGSWTIIAVVQEARVSVGLTGPQHFGWLQRTQDGTDHVNGSIAPTTAFNSFQNILPLNPHTSATWVAGDLINSGLESLA